MVLALGPGEQGIAGIQEHGGRKEEVLHPVSPTTESFSIARGERLREAVRHKDVDEAERIFAALGMQIGER